MVGQLVLVKNELNNHKPANSLQACSRFTGRSGLIILWQKGVAKDPPTQEWGIRDSQRRHFEPSVSVRVVAKSEESGA